MDTLKLVVEIVRAKVTVSSRHLKRHMAEDAAEPIQVAPVLHPPACKRVPQIMETKVLNSRSRAGSLECLPRVADTRTISFAEQEGRPWAEPLLQKFADRREGRGRQGDAAGGE